MPDLPTAPGLARFSAVAAAHVGNETVPGLVAVAARGDQVHTEALGSLSVGGPAVRRDSLFRIASNSKPVTGAATLALVREGLLRLDCRRRPTRPSPDPGRIRATRKHLRRRGPGEYPQAMTIQRRRFHPH